MVSLDKIQCKDIYRTRHFAQNTMHGMICVEMNAMHIKIFIEYYGIHEIMEGVPIKMRLGFCSIALAILIQQGLDYILLKTAVDGVLLYFL